MQQHDVIVVGAGPAGSTTASLLAQAGIDVLLVDKATFPRDKTCGDCLSPRAQAILHQMGILEQVDRQAHHAPAIRVYAPNGGCAETAVTGLANLPHRTLVIPRYHFDHILQQHAIDSGTTFQVGQAQRLLLNDNRVIGVTVNDQDVRSALVVLATGASTGLLKASGMLPQQPRFSVAARRYYHNLPSLDPHLEVYLNQVALPGYAWFFPTGPHSANVGVWYSGRWPVSARAALNTLTCQHPRLRHMLQEAQPVAAMKSYPIRTDFLTAQKQWPGMLGVGEAIGLVNPFTGEGIDYALESGQIAAQVLTSILATDTPELARFQQYEQQLNSHFRQLFQIMTLAHCLAGYVPLFNRIFGGNRSNQPLVDALIQTCFGMTDMSVLLRPHFLLQLLRSRPMTT